MKKFLKTFVWVFAIMLLLWGSYGTIKEINRLDREDFEPVTKVVIAKGEYRDGTAYVTADDRTYVLLRRPYWETVKIGDKVTQPRKYWQSFDQ